MQILATHLLAKITEDAVLTISHAIQATVFAVTALNYLADNFAKIVRNFSNSPEIVVSSVLQ